VNVLALRRDYAAAVHASLMQAWRAASEAAPGEWGGFEELIAELQDTLSRAESALRAAELQAA
jgi:hypothetical protein